MSTPLCYEPPAFSELFIISTDGAGLKTIGTPLPKNVHSYSIITTDGFLRIE
jgi:hypothetical protein